MTAIAACMIAKDAAPTIAAALASIRPLVDEVNVYDTGSTDGTLDLLARAASEPGCPVRVDRGEWRDDFAAARTASFAMASPGCDWLLWLDADDVAEGSPRALAAVAAADVDGFRVSYASGALASGEATVEVWYERLVRRSAGLEWRERIHEGLRPPPGKTVRLEYAPRHLLRFVHRRERGTHTDRNVRLLLADLDAEERGGGARPRTLYCLGVELQFVGRHRDALGYFARYLGHPGVARSSDGRMRVSFLTVECLLALGDHDAATREGMRAVDERDDWPETALGLARSHAAAGAWDDAERWAQRALDLGTPRTLEPLYPYRHTAAPLLVLARAALERGRLDDARAWTSKLEAALP